MKHLLFLFISTIGMIATGQAPLTHQFDVKGAVEKEVTITLADISALSPVLLGDLDIVNHSGQTVNTARQVKGVLLRDVLRSISITSPSDRELSCYYLLCTASDGYTVTFSWNEVFNSTDVYVVVEVDGVPLGQYPKSIQLFDRRDIQSGRRFMRGLSTIEIKKG